MGHRLGTLRRVVGVLLLCGLAAQGYGQDAKSSTDTVAMGHMRYAIKSLMSHYNAATGLWRTEGWWNAANTVTEIGNAQAIDPEPIYLEVLDRTFSQAPREHAFFLNKAYDDEGWWALAWVQAYDVTHKEAYLKMAETIFDNINGAWDDTCGGGVWWNPGRRYKNAITNELYLSLAAHLAARTTGKKHDKYLDAAMREWKWFSASGMINPHHLINDGLTEQCTNNHQTAWTYNQGVILGGLAELSRVTGDKTLLEQANVLAQAAIKSPKLVNAHGVMHESTEPNCGPDGINFKGIFFRNLAELNAASPHEEYAQSIRSNAEAAWKNARTAQGDFACSWTAAPVGENAGTSTSALGVLVAAAGLK